MKRSIALLFSLLIPVTAFAAVFQAAGGDDELFTVSVPIQDDLYVAGGLVHVNESVAGDLIIAGGEIEVSGDINQDVIAAGGSVNIRGRVNDDVRAAGGEMEIAGTVGDDLIIAGGNIRITKGAVIEGDAYVFGGLLIIDGLVKGNLRTAGGDVILTGNVNGDIDVNSDHFQIEGVVKGDAQVISEEAKVGENAFIAGDLEYWMAKDSDPYSSKVGGTAKFNPELRAVTKDVFEATAKGALKVALMAIFGYSLLAAVLFIFIMLLITKTYFNDCSMKAIKAPGRSALIGLLYFVVTPVIGVLFLITVIGIPISLFIFMMYGFMIFFAKPLTAIVLAKSTEIRYGKKKKWSKTKIFFASVGYFIALKVIGIIPVIGWILVMIGVFIAFGAMLDTDWEKWKKIS
ncbi:MAG: hypothetical protein QF755_05370 [Candidatus Peribacteraceae bacterium]|jgi:hypothetical protein|nr:hypothetical protein [Candidatus Peribacteraceae bacterium]HCI03765.1 hypothetical protein [Candidatus Peribacteria bacterium]|tara:strand:+ start:1788 stop:2993 length:1206 start_codon:yes stop_codon:yes gene_type:complete